MYKLFEIFFNNGRFYDSRYYIAESKEDVMKNSKIYKEFEEYKEANGGDLVIFEVNFNNHRFPIENIDDFIVNINIGKKE